MTKTYPVDADGNMRRTTNGWYIGRDEETRKPIIDYPTMRENTPFFATLHYKGYWRGSSAICFEWVDSEGHRFPMFMTDMHKLAESGVLVNGAAHGWWRAVKRGSFYGIQHVRNDA